MEFITRCPSCQMAFYVAATQLKVADGKVRCGACLTIFNAEQQGESQPTPAEPKEVLHSELLIHDDMDLDALHEETSSDEETSPDKESSSHKEPSQPEPLLFDTETDSTLLLPPPEPARQPPVTEIPSGDVIQLGRDTLEPDRNAESELDDDFPFALELPQPRRQRFKPGTIAACLFALLALPMQYIYFHTDQLSQTLVYRSWLVPLCEFLGCEVQPLIDRDKISSQQLLIVSHPTEPDALLVEAVLINQAPFTQPFPTLLLQFGNLQGAVIAQRHFQPEHYLNGDLLGSDQFPSNRPVRIRLEIVDPGPDATNYSLLVTK